MSITVRDCLKLPSLQNGRVIAGTKGLSRIVNSVSVLEVIDSSMFNLDNSVDNGDLCISSLFSIKDDKEMQHKLIEHLNNMGDACLVLYYVGIYLDKVDEEMINAANDLEFPIILMPENRLDFRYNEAISEVSDILRRDKNSSSNFIDKIATLVSHLPENKKTLSNLMRIISDNLKCTLLLCDSSMVHILLSPWPLSNNLNAGEIISAYEKTAAQGEIMISASIKDTSVNIFKVPFSASLYSNYSLYGVDTFKAVNLDDLYQVTELLLIFSKLWDIDKEDILAGALIPTIMAGDESNMRLISKKLSLDIDSINSTLIIDVSMARNEDYSSIYLLKQSTIQAIKTLSEEMDKRIIIDTYGIYILCFLNLSSCNAYDEEYIKGIESALRKFTEDYTLSLFTNDDNIMDVRKTYELYLETIGNAQIIFPQKKLFSYGDLVFTNRCMNALKENSDELRICKNIIEPLKDIHDKDNLLETLSTYYLDCDCKINKTSEILFLHRNTIQYRLNKIKEITNYNPSSSLDFALLQLATGCNRLEEFRDLKI